LKCHKLAHGPSDASMASSLPVFREMRRRGMRAASGRVCRCVLAASLLVLVGHRLSGPLRPSSLAFAPAPQLASSGAAAEVPRREALAWAASAGLGLASAAVAAGEQPALAAEEAWRKDIPRALEALKGYSRDWETLMKEGENTKGANIVREGIVIRYTDVYKVKLAPGEKLGVRLNLCKVLAVEKPEFGWQEGDKILYVNDQVLNGDDNVFKETVKIAQAEGKPLIVSAGREGPALFDDFDRKLKQAYEVIDDDKLPDLDDLLLLIANTKVQANSAASATNASQDTINRLKVEINGLIKSLTPIAKAVSV